MVVEINYLDAKQLRREVLGQTQWPRCWNWRELACGRAPWHSRPIVQVTSGDLVLTHDLRPVIPYFYATYTTTCGRLTSFRSRRIANFPVSEHVCVQPDTNRFLPLLANCGSPAGNASPAQALRREL